MCMCVCARASWCSSLFCLGLTSASLCAWVLSLLSAILWSRLLGFYTPMFLLLLYYVIGMSPVFSLPIRSFWALVPFDACSFSNDKVTHNEETIENET